VRKMNSAAKVRQTSRIDKTVRYIRVSVRNMARSCFIRFTA
jgi:hypothetical protein